MKKLIYLLMSLSFVAFVACEDKDTPVNNENTQTENGNNDGNSGNNGDANDNVTAIIVGTENGHEWVDLGLPSGTKWATCNVGASKPQDYGNYYAWGETTTKEVYYWNTYLDGRISGYYGCGTGSDLLNGVSDIAGTQYDAAYVNWGGKWRMPTYDQQVELLKECYWVWTKSYNNSNVNGYIVYKAKTSSDKGVMGETPSSSYSLKDAHIFLPAAGYRDAGDLNFAGSGGYYWSSSLNTGNPLFAFEVSLSSIYIDISWRCEGQSVRAVIK